MPRSGPPKYNPKKIKEDFEEELDFTKYQKEFQKLISICEKLDKSKDSEMIEAGKNYIIVRLFSLFDVEGRVIITDLIDRFGVKPSQALDETHLNVELDELEKLRVRKYLITIHSIVPLRKNNMSLII